MIVVGQQQCVVPGPQLSDYVYEAKSTMSCFCMVRLRSVAGVFYNFRIACSSLARRWTFASIARLGVLPPLLRLIAELYESCVSLRLFAGGVAGEIEDEAGVSA